MQDLNILVFRYWTYVHNSKNLAFNFALPNMQEIQAENSITFFDNSSQVGAKKRGCAFTPAK